MSGRRRTPDGATCREAPGGRQEWGTRGSDLLVTVRGSNGHGVMCRQHADHFGGRWRTASWVPLERRLPVLRALRITAHSLPSLYQQSRPAVVRGRTEKGSLSHAPARAYQDANATEPGSGELHRERA